MTYQSYVLAAYGVFAVVLLWDFVVPKIRIAHLMRALRVLARRQARAADAPTGELHR